MWDNPFLWLPICQWQKYLCGRYSKEKGIDTLIEACQNLPKLRFVFAGTGSEDILNKIKKVNNINEVGFLTGDKLNNLISGAEFSIYPSEWYENCPFSVIESQMLGTPVIGADIGGIPELVENKHTGLLFKSGKIESLTDAINKLYQDNELRAEMVKNCLNKKYMTLDEYYEKIMEVYGG